MRSAIFRSVYNKQKNKGAQGVVDSLNYLRQNGVDAVTDADLKEKAASPNLPDTQAGSADTLETSPSKRRRKYTSLFVGGNGTGANM